MSSFRLLGQLSACVRCVSESGNLLPGKRNAYSQKLMKSTTQANKTFLGANVPRSLDRASVKRILSRHSSRFVFLILVSLQFVLAIAGCGSFMGANRVSSGGPIPTPTPPSTTVSVSPHTTSSQVNGQQQFTASD